MIKFKKLDVSNQGHGYMLSKVPTSFIGKLFIWYLRRHLNRGKFVCVVRGQNPKKGKSRQGRRYLPLKDARTVRIYIRAKCTQEQHSRFFLGEDGSYEEKFMA